jgi:hypothetical protein
MLSATSRTPCYTRDDVVDRLVILKTVRIEGSDQEDFKSDVQKEVECNRAALWGEIIYKCQKILRILDETDWKSIKVPGQRMQEFARFTIVLGQTEGNEDIAFEAWRKMKPIQRNFVIEGEPLFDVLSTWVKDHEGQSLTAGKLNVALNDIAKSQGIHWPYKDGRSLGQTLKQLDFNIRKGREKQYLYSFRLKKVQESN